MNKKVKKKAKNSIKDNEIRLRLIPQDLFDAIKNSADKYEREHPAEVIYQLKRVYFPEQ